jgi:hypothetical protein
VNQATDRKDHWENVYRHKTADQTSWHQDVPQLSLAMIDKALSDRNTPIIDIGGGASLLVDHLLERGYSDLTILEISAAAITQSKARLGGRAEVPSWLEADVTRFNPSRRYGLWHDRAAFHFLTDPEDRQSYVDILTRALELQGQAIIATFSLQGPKKCSGLDIVQYDAEKMALILGPAFVLLEEQEELHITPRGGEQRFNFFRFQKIQ